MKTIAIVVQNVIQYYSVRPLINLLKTKNNIQFDFLVYDPDDSSPGFHSIANDVRTVAAKDGVNCKTTARKEYTLTLSPYVYPFPFKTKYIIGYVYGAATTKPAVTLLPDFKKGFHAILLHDTYGAEVYSVYAHTYIVPDLLLKPVEPKATRKKPVLLYLPTYHDPNTLKVAETLQELRSNYYIISKGHHGIDNLSDEGEKKNLLALISDENYPSSQHIGPLLEKADVVLSDNSSAIMDALYANVPVAIAAPLIAQDLNNIKPLQQILIESKVIPYAQTISKEELNKILKKALSEKQKKVQSETSAHLFPNKKGGASSWYQIIEKYLNDEIDQNYVKLHDYYTQKQDNITKELINKIDQLTQDRDLLNSRVVEYEKRLARNPLRKIKRFICNRRRKHE